MFGSTGTEQGDRIVSGLIILQSLAAALSVTPVAVTPIANVPDRQSTASGEVQSSVKPAPRVRTRDERIGTVALRGFAGNDETWFPPAKSWGDPSGPVFELGALGARRSGQPDVAHMSLNWQF